MESKINEYNRGAWVATLLQVSDPLFPTGAYAHSMGLEQWAATQQFRSADDLTHFLIEHAGPSLARLELPYLRYLRHAFKKSEWISIYDLDTEINAWKWSKELREASIIQGGGRLRLIRKLWPDHKKVIEFEKRRRSKLLIGHHLVISALQFECLDIPEEATYFAYGYQNFANFTSAAIKLLRISPETAQAALAHALDSLPQWIAEAKIVNRDAAGWFAPAFDIESARHATAFSRLFIS